MNTTNEAIQEVIRLFSSYMDDYLYIMDLKNDTYRISSYAVERFRLPSDYFEGAAKKHELFVYEEDYPLLNEEFRLMLSGEKKAHNLHYRWVGRDGSPVWINCRGGVLDDEEGRPRYLIGCINETGKKQRADNVSGLLGELELSDYIAGHRDENTSGFLMRIGIDDFSAVNSMAGTAYGDYVLKEVADCIKGCLEEKQQLFHIVSDEYMVVDFGEHTARQAVALYKTIRSRIAEFIDSEKYRAVFTISAGVIGSEIFAEGYDELMKLSDFALKQAQAQSKNSCYIYSEEDYQRFLRKNNITVELQCAVDNDFSGFEAYYQPIVDTETSRLIGAEALMRFSVKKGEEIQRISPAEFVPILEETGLILPTGKWILNESVAMCSEMQKRIPGFKININISYIQVMKSDILEDILSAIKQYKLPPECIGIELTESGYLGSDPHFLKLRNGLKKNGIQFIIDDFGTGYSNLHCISELSPSYIKIDRDFTNKAMSNTYDYELMVKIIEMAHSLDIRICIEGVEEKTVCDEVRKIHADYIQGYLFGRPCSKVEFCSNYCKS